MTPKALACIVTIRGCLVRLYGHPTVPDGRPWVAIEDMARAGGYEPEQAADVAAKWQATYPQLADVGEDGAVIVSDAAVCAFIAFLGMVGAITVDQVRDDYEAEAGRAWLVATAGLPRASWLQAVQMSAVADALPDPEGRVN